MEIMSNGVHLSTEMCNEYCAYFMHIFSMVPTCRISADLNVSSVLALGLLAPPAALPHTRHLGHLLLRRGDEISDHSFSEWGFAVLK